MFVVIVDFEVEPAGVAEFTAAVRKQALDSLSSEEHCLRFDVSSDPDHPEIVFLYEVYRTRADFNDHLQSAHFLNFDQSIRPYVKRKSVRFLSRILGKD